jgi:AraC family transcriptional regulator
VPSVGGSFLARLSSRAGRGAAWLANSAAHRAIQKLSDDLLSLTDVAAECGFCDQSHFTQHFIVGVSPGAWRCALKE